MRYQQFILVFILLFMSMFASKIGVIDLSVLSYSAIGILLIIRIKSPKLPAEQLVLMKMGFLILLYSILLLLITDSNESYVVFRNVRALLSIAILGTVFYNINIPLKGLLNIIIIVIIMHSIAIDLQMLYSPIKMYLAPIVGYNKELLPLRAFGLIGDYDSAGLLCIIGTIISLQLLFHTKSIKYLFSGFLCSMSVFFTSRLNMLILLAILILASLLWLKSRRSTIKSKIFIIISSLIVGYYIVLLVIPLLYSTIPLIKENFSLSNNQSIYIYDSSYGMGSQEYLLNSMWILPDEIAGTIFGTGYSPAKSDIGYVNIIFMIGLVGLLVLILFYSYLLRSLRQSMKFLAKINNDNFYINTSIYSLIAIILLLFIYNIKLLYLFTRTFHEILIIMYFTIIANVNRLIIQSSATMKDTSCLKNNTAVQK
jgi:hypothetical protein